MKQYQRYFPRVRIRNCFDYVPLQWRFETLQKRYTYLEVKQLPALFSMSSSRFLLILAALGILSNLIWRQSGFCYFIFIVTAYQKT